VLIAVGHDKIDAAGLKISPAVFFIGTVVVRQER